VYLNGTTDYIEFYTDSSLAATLGKDYTYAEGFLISGGTGGGGGAADHLGNHVTTQNLVLGSNWISGDGGNEGISIDANGKVGIGTASPSQSLSVDGKIQSDEEYHRTLVVADGWAINAYWEVVQGSPEQAGANSHWEV